MAANVSSEGRGQWGSSFGFIMAAAGSAVGLGNIWRFPYITGQNGGGAFLVVYFLCVVLIGLPLMYNEIALGRFTGKNPIGAFQVTKGKGLWMIGPVLSVLLCFFVLSYYSVIAGWTIYYIFTSLFGVEVNFAEFTANPVYVIPLGFAFIALTAFVVLGGVSGGIEKASKILMPLLLVLILAVVARSLTLEGASAGLDYYLNPDFSKINGSVFLAALGQAFFSLSVGWGLMVTYGSYLPKSNNLVKSGFLIGLADTLVAFLGGLMIFPAVFAFGKQPDAGPTLVFQVLPEIFESLPGPGNIVGGIFFLMLTVAALTSSISMLEVPVSYFIDDKKWNRKKATFVVAILVMVFSIPSALSSGGSALFSGWSFSIFQTPIGSFFDLIDFIFGTLSLVIVSLVFTLFVGWKMDVKTISNEIEQGAPFFYKKFLFGFSPAQLWIFFIRFICPIVIIFVLLNMVGAFGTPGEGG